jgi:flavin-binding protein dodecin
MSMLNVVEVLAESDKSWEEAANIAIAKAAETVRNVRSIYIEELEASVANGRIAQFRINAKVTFELE